MIKKIFTIETNPGRLGLTFTSPRRPTVRQRARRNPVAALLAAGWLAAIASAGAASAEQSVTLAWNPSPDASVVGYHVRAREENSTTNVSTDVGGRTKATLPGLKAGLRYTFTVTAYNQAGLESAPSNAAEFVAPVPCSYCRA